MEEFKKRICKINELNETKNQLKEKIKLIDLDIWNNEMIIFLLVDRENIFLTDKKEISYLKKIGKKIQKFITNQKAL